MNYFTANTTENKRACKLRTVIEIAVKSELESRQSILNTLISCGVTNLNAYQNV
jgi:hypothetical protein